MLAILVIAGVLLFGAEAQHNAHCEQGRTVIVHLFEWKFTDIAAECERWLGPMKYCGVQVSPVNEHRVMTSPWQPWWQRYQPVSYKLQSRSGSEDQFSNMVERCYKVGVRIFVDIVINHMTGSGSGQGSAGSSYDGDTLQFPGVPFGPTDFNCCNCDRCNSNDCQIQDYNDKTQVRNCRLYGRRDIQLDKDYVRGKIAGFLNTLIAYGVAGFRVDASQNMWPSDLQNIYSRVNNLNERWFVPGLRPFIYQEIKNLGSEAIKSPEYTGIGCVTEFKYGKELGDIIRKNGGQKLKNLRNFGEGWGMLQSNKSVPFVDNHENQRDYDSSILTFFESTMYKIANAFMLAWPYGQVRIMSSYWWDRQVKNGKDINSWMGPPSEKNGSPKNVTINNVNMCGNGWVCEHRWHQINNMVRFRNVADGHIVNNWWDNGNNQIAFSRGKIAFLVINNDDFPLTQTLQTGLPQGDYCDVISGNLEHGCCTGRIIKVDGDGRARFYITNKSNNPFVAIHIKAKLLD